jgi:hypothetical protein
MCICIHLQQAVELEPDNATTADSLKKAQEKAKTSTKSRGVTSSSSRGSSAGGAPGGGFDMSALAGICTLACM